MALHQKAVLGYEIAPNENNASWSTLLDKLQNQGIQQVSLVGTDGFKGLEQMISQAYPLAKQQRCFIHISRNLASKVTRSDRAVILEQFKMIYRDGKFGECGQSFNFLSVSLPNLAQHLFDKLH
ncbi:hypothetical protein HMPREF9176_1593 [Streptococcus downei F0415]|nr:hypothetical protein HMPREF9176_1593 [Streptococcus downei F0415]